MTPDRLRALLRDCPPAQRAALVHVLATAGPMICAPTHSAAIVPLAPILPRRTLRA